MRLPVSIPVFVSLVLVVGGVRGADIKSKKLIEFGWDEPGTAFLREHSAAMQKTPFDGCVFHVDLKRTNGAAGSFTWLAWGKEQFTQADLKDAFADLRALRPGEFNSNFLRFNTTPATLDWFDDYSAVIANAKLAAQLAHAGGCAGILFDVEHYEGHLFDYRKQRDAKTKSWELYAAQAHRRGEEVMRAFQDGYPNVTIFLTYGYSLCWAETGFGKISLSEVDYGLLAPFLDGMVAAAKGRTHIVDGGEMAYGYKTAAQFAAFKTMVTNGVLPIVRDPRKYRETVSCAFGLWLDNDWRKLGWNTEDFTKNYFTPEAFEQSVRAALQATDQYVWIYSETPRWWAPAGGSTNLPAAYDRAIRNARERE